MKRVAVLVCLLLLASFSMFAGPVPPEVIVNAGGLEWVWASPCAPTGPSCGADIVGENGFRLATIDEWLASFTDNIDLYNQFEGGAKCASPYFSSGWTHCDPSDVLAGYVWGAPPPISNGLGFNDNPLAEGFLVRGASGVPEPSTLSLFGLALATVVAWRRRK